ncbi:MULTISPECIES: hypothetical protein [Metasolibacillus]|uniref:hypothetical protein n=1 Tax=Metasolibacillus TaxID=2703677 RepID=UPI0007964023|nr:hypothetical protein [Metasolibacillus fluoroglycofenilyticus]KYG91977.1 hypothetical protein A0U40_03295 [[Bacillus] sp. KCTC 13219]
MQEINQSQVRELICINVDKVYDWIVKELTFELTPQGAVAFPTLPAGVDLTHASIQCRVVPDPTNPVVILSRENRQFTLSGRSVKLQQLTVQKNFIVTIVVKTANNMMYESESFNISRCEQITLCAPKGTDVKVTYTDLDCFVCSTGAITPEFPTGGTPTITFTNLSVTVTVCQSIQSTFPVTVEFLAEYCEPRADFPISCSPAARPQKCGNVFPSNC